MERYTFSSWLNLIERWSAGLSNKAIQRNAVSSVADLIETIDQFVDAHNDDPKAFVWTANVEQIVRKVTKRKAILGTQRQAPRYTTARFSRQLRDFCGSQSCTVMLSTALLSVGGS